MTLAQWIELWPYVGRNFTQSQLGPVTPNPDHTSAYVVADACVDEALRAKAWTLTDYRVSAVSGGSIWFIPRVEADPRD